MLLGFSVSNFRSFKDTVELSMEASSLRELPQNAMDADGHRLLKSVAIFGANAAGKSNLVRAMASAIMIIRTSGARQLNAPIPWVEPFAFQKGDKGETSFEFDFLAEGRRYIYAFSCTRDRITGESLMEYGSQRPARIFTRTGQRYAFYNAATRKVLEPIAERNTPNKLFLATATSWNAEVTKAPFLWFSRCIDAFDSGNPMRQSLQLYEDDGDGSLKAFTRRLLRESDINISDFSVESRNPTGTVPGMGGYPMHKEYVVMSKHDITEGDGTVSEYSLPMIAESKGTQNLFLLSPQIKNAIDNGYVFCVDELDASMHPALLLYIVDIFNSPETNPHGAQLIMTSHTTDLLSTAVLRRDQILFVEKKRGSGISDLYRLSDFPVRANEDVRKAYMAGRFGAVPDIL